MAKFYFYFTSTFLDNHSIFLGKDYVIYPAIDSHCPNFDVTCRRVKYHYEFTLSHEEKWDSYDKSKNIYFYSFL